MVRRIFFVNTRQGKRALDAAGQTQYNDFTAIKRNDVILMIVLDLEWNRGYDRKPLNEILQIGAVRVEHPGGPVLDAFNAYIKPVVHKKFDRGASKLPELRASKESPLDFASAMEAFRAWCGGETAFASWGGGDLETLAESCKYWGLESLTSETFYDFQRAFSHRLGTDQQVALWRAVCYCGIPDVFSFHNALYDALYTAILGGWLGADDLEWGSRPPRSRRETSLQLSSLPFPPQPRQRVGPFPTPQQVLDAKNSRKPACPLCGRTACVTRWHAAPLRRGAAPRQYFSAFSCPEHGQFLCRLTLSQRPDGLWLGRRGIPAITPELTREYAGALAGEVHTCRGKRKKRRRSAPRADSP